MSNQHILRAQLIYLSQSTLLLPNTAVAEVTYLDSISPMQSAPVWIHGLIKWRGLTLPLINIDALLIYKAIALNENQRVVVLNSSSINSDIPFMAIAAVGNPHLIKLTEESLDDELTEQHSSPYIHAQHTLDEQKLLIPNIGTIEKLLHETIKEAKL